MEDYSDNEFEDENSQDRIDPTEYSEVKQDFSGQSKEKNISSSVQEFLKQSNEIQEEIRKLSELCQQISPKKDSSMDDGPKEKEDYEERSIFWEQINNLLETHGFRPINFIQDEDMQEVPDMVSLSDTVVDLITEYTKLHRNYSEIEAAYSVLKSDNKELAILAEKSKKFENQFKEIDKINRQLQEKLNKCRQELKNKDDNFNSANIIKNSTGDYRSSSIFKAFIRQEFDPNRDIDVRIMEMIQHYEEQMNSMNLKLLSNKKEIENLNSSFKKYKQKLTEEKNYAYNKASQSRNHFSYPDEETSEKLKILSSVVNILSLKSYQEIPSALGKIQQVMLTLPGIDKFVKQICEEIMMSPTSRLDEVLDTLRDIKRKLQTLENFKGSIIENLLISNDQDIIEKIKALSYFCKLFEIKAKDDIKSIIEGVFFFVHEIKLFLSVIYS